MKNFYTLALLVVANGRRFRQPGRTLVDGSSQPAYTVVAWGQAQVIWHDGGYVSFLSPDHFCLLVNPRQLDDGTYPDSVQADRLHDQMCQVHRDLFAKSRT